MVTEAMKVGKHAISAVPAGMSDEELELLLETVKKTGMKYMIMKQSLTPCPASSRINPPCAAASI
jgi:hypothetical protein